MGFEVGFDHGPIVFALGPGLMRWFQTLAPGITLRFVDIDGDLERGFASREIDLAFLPELHLGELIPAGIVHQTLIEDRTVVMMRADHPLQGMDEISPTDLAAYEHVAFHPSWEAIDHRRAVSNFRRNLPVRIRMGQVTLLPFFLEGTDLISLAPEWLAIGMGLRLGLTYRPISYDEPPIRSVIAWSPIQDADPAHQWVRREILNWAEDASPRSVGPV